MTSDQSETATFCGQSPDRGRIIIGKEFPGEGYAVAKCGGTEVQISYTILHNLIIDISPNPLLTGDQQQLQKALHSLTCEASLGRTGD